ncbi:NAD-dependent epimerase/dehydratase family protein [Nakamurella endophytica]|uniref:Nucleoside-diphosphate sugar epimerase n=1 Tax=Nakamurella endophytica TaxID=1748367 RepID=A0A917SND8_9ACTN|nr:NAD-dependent epimerase/dehydratase family protein [Nakamurella endophytica]GGL88324.1 nucleoside-diphosphate sugar epimerase [Nakamurella endophytica]
MRILLTGGTGLLGGATARALLDRGDEVTVLQRRPAGLGCREVLADVTDRDAVARAAAGQDAVLHLAAKVGIQGTWREFAAANIGGTQAVVRGCRAGGVGRLVHVSSPSVAHAGDPLVGAGAQPADPEGARGDYSRSKAVAEQVALAADAPDLAVLAVRPHLVWGAGDRQLVAKIVDRARRGRLPLVGTGAALIDSTYLDNAVDALVAAVDVCGAAHGEALVVSNGEPRPVGELLQRICQAHGVPGPRGRVPLPVAVAAGAVAEQVFRRLRPASDPPMSRFLAEQLGTAHWFDQRRTREVLRWVPRIPLEQGFAALAAHAAGAGT